MYNPPMTLEQPLTLKQVASLYGVSRQAVYLWVRDGKLRTIQQGEGFRHFVTWAALREFDARRPERWQIFKKA